MPTPSAKKRRIQQVLRSLPLNPAQRELFAGGVDALSNESLDEAEKLLQQFAESLPAAHAAAMRIRNRSNGAPPVRLPDAVRAGDGLLPQPCAPAVCGPALLAASTER